ncbi:protein-tyrosine phosphatase-like protein, partial [Blyttiomyces helicus]
LSRYYDILPYDGSRVKLHRPNPSDGSDYVNASFVTGLPSTRTYIASQGPLPHTIGDFWQMVWEQNTEVIVMLTREDERGRPKCAPYWPPNRTSPVEFPALGGLVVTLLDESHMNAQETVLRKLSISLSRDCTTPPRIVWHVHFLAWPDHRGSNPQTVLGVVALARSLQAPSAGPMLVHCSAGCGRTGTFCTIDAVLSLLERAREPLHDPHADPVAATVAALRKHRVYMVQTLEQYAFCYEAVLCRILEWQHSGVECPGWVVRRDSLES